MKKRIPVFGLVFLLLAGCTAEEAAVTRSIFAMDTYMELTAYGEQAQTALEQAKKEIGRLDALFRRGSEQSEVFQINDKKNACVSADTAALIRRAADISADTDGAFDPTVAPVMDLWGFYGRTYRVPAAAELSKTLADVDYKQMHIQDDTVALDGNAKLDLGGIAKGYASDRMMQVFRENGVTSGLVSLGGNVQALGSRPDGSPWRIGIQHPDGEGYIGIVQICDEAVITSGGYQRFFEKDGQVYHHILDPKTGYPARSGLKSVSVISSDGTLADGLSTAIFVMGLDAGSAYWRTRGGFELVLMTEDNVVYVTEGIQNRFDTQMNYVVIRR